MPLLPSGSPMPGVGAITPTPAGAPAGAVAASDLFGFCAVPAGGAGVAAVVWVGALAGACAAAGVSQAAAKAIAHPMCFISTPVTCLEPEGTGPRLPSCALYRRGFSEPQAPDPR